ncbi:MAG: hypothetical protein ACREB2_14315 [Pseudolabrys sp.]
MSDKPAPHGIRNRSTSLPFPFFALQCRFDFKTYPHVSQFWTYGKEKFLQQPVYSRDFPPCKYCE